VGGRTTKVGVGHRLQPWTKIEPLRPELRLQDRSVALGADKTTLLAQGLRCCSKLLIRGVDQDRSL
jgi:hypothetical protein